MFGKQIAGLPGWPKLRCLQGSLLLAKWNNRYTTQTIPLALKTIEAQINKKESGTGQLELPELVVTVACLTVLFALQGKLHRSFRAWKSFKLKSVRDKTLRDKACNHHNKTLQRKAVQAWKGYIHNCFRIKVDDLCTSFLGQRFWPYVLGYSHISYFEFYTSCLGGYYWLSPFSGTFSPVPVVEGLHTNFKSLMFYD